MSNRIPEGYCEAWLQFNTPGDAENMYVSIGVDLAVGVTPNQITTNTILNTMLGAIDDGVSSSYSCGPGHVIWGASGGDIRIDSTNAAAPGLNAAAAFPPNVALLVRKLTNFGGRRGRGRCYMPGLSEGSAGSDGALAPADLTARQSDWDDLLTNTVALADVDALVLFHDTAPFLPYQITGFAVQRKVATQRRRLRP